MNPTTDNIIQLLASGYTVKEIAAMLSLKKPSLDKRIHRLKLKYACKNATQLVVNYLKLAHENIEQE